MTALGSGKIWILVPDWSRLKSSEPKAGDVTCKIDPLYFNKFETTFLFSQSNNQNTEVLSQIIFDKILWRWDKNDFFFQLFIYLYQNITKNKSAVSKSVRMMNKLNAFTKWCSLLLSQVTSPCDFDPSLPLYPNPIDKEMHKVKGRVYSTKWIRL